METVRTGELVAAVRQRAPGAPLDRVEAALAVGEELASCADELIGEFVEEARRAGYSWTEIGHRIGISKQAARQRFTDPRRRAGETYRLGASAAGCLEAARREAAADGSAEVGTHHQLIALFDEWVAPGVLEVRTDTVRAAARELFPRGGLPRVRQPQESAEAREALRRAAAIARQAGRAEVDAEHLFAALALDPGTQARRVLSHLGVNVAAFQKDLDSHNAPAKRRRKRGKADLACSFCTKSQDQVERLIAGPGVYICDQCIDLCNEIITEEAGAQPGKRD